MGGLLSGITVLEVANEFGEWAGRVLADLGARVIKIEPPEGSSTRRIGPFCGDKPDQESSLHFWHYNAGKESVVLDLTSESGRELFRKLAAKCDVLVESLPPGQMAEWSLDYSTLTVLNPRLVYASVTPFGQTGPHRDWKATDLTLLAMGGPMKSCGYDDLELPPIRPAGGQSYQNGGHYATIGILLALIQRRATGRGQHVDVPIQACLAVTTEGAANNWLYAGQLVRRQTGRHAAPSLSSPTQHLCGDGRYVNLNAGREGRQWEVLLEWLKEEGIAGELADEKYSDSKVRAEASALILDTIRRLCARHTAMEIFQRGQSLGLAAGAVRRPEEWLDDPHAAARGFLVSVEHPEVGQTYRYPGPPFRFSDAEATIRRRAPLVGEHSDKVRTEFGLSPTEISDGH